MKTRPPRGKSPTACSKGQSSGLRRFPPDEDDLIGSVLEGRYTIRDHLGQGGTAKVYKAQDGQRTVAVKISRSKETNDLIELEAAPLSFLQHSNIVKLLDEGMHEGRSYMVLEYLEGEDLASASARRIAREEMLKILIEVCDALAFIHGLDLLHNDVKGSNIFLTPSGAKLIDFGLSQLLFQAERGISPPMGTPSFMAPEILEGNPFDQRADIYSLGVTMYRMLCGELPFRAESLLQLADTKARGRILAPSQKNPILGIPSEMDAIAMRAIEMNPSRRFQSAREMREALASVSDESN